MGARRSAALVEAGVFLQLSGDVTGARELFRQALSLDPENAKARVLLGDEAHPPANAEASAPAGSQTMFAPPAVPAASDATVPGRPLFSRGPADERARIAAHLADGAFDKALAVALERLKVDADDVEAHELAWDVLVAAGQAELARAQLGNLMEVALLRGDAGRVRRFLEALEHTAPDHPSLQQARALVSQSRVAEPDATLIDDALRSLL